MALLSLSIKRPSEFLEVPPSPPQSPPVVDAAFSPPSPAASADSPLDGFLHLPLPSSAPFHGAPERAKKRRKQERPSLFIVDQSSCGNEEDTDHEPPESRHVEPPADCVPLTWNDMAVPAADVADAPRPEQSPRGCEPVNQGSSVPEPEGLSTPELHPSTAVVKPVQAELTTAPNPVQSSMSSVAFQHHQTPPVPPSGYPSSPAIARVASSGAGSDGEGEGSDGGVPETCPECRKVFKRRVYLQRHMAREHWSTAKVFKCDKCAYETKHQSNLLVHRRTHTGSSSVNSLHPVKTLHKKFGAPRTFRFGDMGGGLKFQLSHPFPKNWLMRSPPYFA